MIRRIIFYVTIVLILFSIAYADTIFLKSAKDKDEVVLARNVVVWEVAKTKTGPVQLVRYYYWNPKKEILISEQRFPEEEATLRVEYSPEKERQGLISSILKKGVSARIFGVDGATTDLFCLKVYYRPKSGYAYYGKGPDDVTFVHVKLAEDPAGKRIELSDISSIEWIGKEDAKIMLKNGKILKGTIMDRIGLQGLDTEGEKIISKSLEDVMKIEIIHSVKVGGEL